MISGYDVINYRRYFRLLFHRKIANNLSLAFAPNDSANKKVFILGK